MAQLTVTVPDQLIPIIIPYARIALQNAGIDTSILSDAQVGRRFIVGVLRRVYEDIVVEAAQTDAQQAIETARQTAKQNANGIT